MAELVTASNLELAALDKRVGSNPVPGIQIRPLQLCNRLLLSSIMSQADTALMPRPGNKIHIPLTERHAVQLLGKVKATADMPRPGATGKKASPSTKRN